MQNLLSLWSTMDARRRLVVVGATIAMFLAILAMSRMAGAPSKSLLYAGLDSSAAGEVVAALEQQGVAYEIRGDAIHVESGLRDSLRMTLASEGLPANSGMGYELLDGLSGFGTTSQMFDAAYWRAKEGELARTILANPHVRAARVHIAQAPSQPFQRDVDPSASVTVTTAAGGLAPGQANALRHLIAAAVTGMRPEDVAVIDTAAGLIALETDPANPGRSDLRAAELRRNVERLLAARVGPGRAVVEVAVDVVTDREAVTERRFDPQGRVAISSDTEAKKGIEAGGGEVTVASNLPDGDASATGDAGRSETEETRERVNYEVSETSREILRMPGSLRKISVAVLVDGVSATAADGTVTQEPRSEEELAVLRELVASAVGLDEARGDVLTLKSLAFETPAAEGTLAEAGGPGVLGPIDTMAAIQLGVLALVAVILGLFVIRPMLTAQPAAPVLPAPQSPLALGSSPVAAGAYGDNSRVLTGEIDDGGDLPDMSVVSEIDPPETASDPASRLRRLIEERQAESLEILRGWMEQQEERA